MATISIHQNEYGVSFERASIRDFKPRYESEQCFIATVSISTGVDEVLIYFKSERDFFEFCSKHNIEVEDKRLKAVK